MGARWRCSGEAGRRVACSGAPAGRRRHRPAATYLYIIRTIDNNAAACSNVTMAGQFRNGSQRRGRPAVIPRAPPSAATAMYLYIVRIIDNNAPPVLKLPRGQEAAQADRRLPGALRTAGRCAAWQ